MSDYMGNIGSYLSTNTDARTAAAPDKRVTDKSGMDMQDFLMLMITELQHQGIDSSTDTSDMLNQMVMMQMVEAITNMTDASVMGYAASLVGKTVTVGQFDSDGKLKEIVGTVTGTGKMDGQQVVFIGDKYYYMNEIMAVGTLPKLEEKPPVDKPDGNPDEKPEEKPPVENPDEKPPVPPVEDKSVSPKNMEAGGRL